MNHSESSKLQGDLVIEISSQLCEIYLQELYQGLTLITKDKSLHISSRGRGKGAIFANVRAPSSSQQGLLPGETS